MKYLVNVKTKEILKEAKSIGQVWVDTQEDLELMDIKNPILESIEQEDGSVKTTFRDLTKEELKPYLLISINADYESSITSLTSGVPTSEIATWPDQKSEAKAWKLDNSVDTPLIDSICLTRGCDKEYLVSKILAKNEYYSIEVGKLTGIRQKLEKEILGESDGINS